MSPARSHTYTLIRILAALTLMLYALVVALLALTMAFPKWGQDPHAVRQPGDDFSFYLPPQFIVAFWVTLLAFALAAVIGVSQIVANRAAGHSADARLFLVLTMLALQGPLLLMANIESHRSLVPAVVEGGSYLVSVGSLLILPVVVLILTRRRSARSYP